MTLHVVFTPEGIPGWIGNAPRDGSEPVEGLTIDFLAAHRRTAEGDWVKRDPVVPVPPTAEEIAVRLDMEPDRVRELLQLAQDPISLETPVGEEEDAHLEDFIQDEEAGVPVDEAGRELLRRELANVLKSLTPREERVLTLRFGLEDGQARTLEELGKEFNVTRERIRQIEAKALRKLRHPSRAKRLRDYLEE